MAQNVTIAGASYTDVTAIEVPKTTSGVASFHDVTDTTATASDVAQGKYFYTADGVKTVGTSLPATITETLDANGGYVLEVTGGLDLSNDTVTAERLLFGYTAHDRSGAAITGTYTPTSETSGVFPNDVNFIDYDGTVVCSYSANEFLVLDSMPTNPTHTGLTSQGWNWSLADAKNYVTNYKYLDIGQTYITSDGKTRLYIEIPDSKLCALTLRIRGLYNFSATVDWGDNTSSSASSSTITDHELPHTYQNVGNYVIAISVESGSFTFIAASSVTSRRGILSGQEILGASSYNVFSDEPFLHMLKKIEFGNNITFIGAYAFIYSGLTSIIIPHGMTQIGESALQESLSLKSIILPSTITTIGNYAISNCRALKYCSTSATTLNLGNGTFRYNYQLRRIFIPPSQTIGGQEAYGYNYSLYCVFIPANITQIKTSCFSNCFGLREIHFKGLTPPTLSSNQAFNLLPTFCKIYVPSGRLSDYTSATNYPSSSKYTYIEE